MWERDFTRPNKPKTPSDSSSERNRSYPLVQQPTQRKVRKKPAPIREPVFKMYLN